LINSTSNRSSIDEDSAVDQIVQCGPKGAILLAGIATSTVVAIWLAFYLFVFLARAAAA
jgi:hypothetical protein